MSQAKLYRQWLNLCKTWGLDERKSGRDLGQYIRKEVGIQFRDAEMSRIPDPVECEKKLKCMERIVNNKYYQATDVDLPTASGLSKDELHIATANETLEFAKYLFDASAMERLKYALSIAFSSKEEMNIEKNESTDKSTTK